MPNTTTPEQQELDKTTAKKVLAADLGNLLRKVKSGRPLTKYERQLVSEAAERGPTEPVQSDAPNFATTKSDLAAVLGISRQLVGYHCRRPGAPTPRKDGRHSVTEWREYLARVGIKTHDDGKPVQTVRPCGVTYVDGLEATFNSMNKHLATLPLPAEAKDILCVLVAADVQHYAKLWGYDDPFAAD